jgi:hypothetical protein
MPASPSVPPIQGLPLPVLPGLLLPADCLAWGANLAQDTRWPAVGNRAISTPISAMISWAPVVPMPGISSSWATGRAKGAIASSIFAVS